MPGVFDGPYELFFKMADLSERPHVHVRGYGKSAKFWIDRIECFRRGRFSDQELNEIERVIKRNQADLLRIWSEGMKKR